MCRRKLAVDDVHRAGQTAILGSGPIVHLGVERGAGETAGCGLGRHHGGGQWCIRY